MNHRRAFFARLASVTSALVAGRKMAAQQTAKPLARNLPVHTPDLPKLPHRMVDGWKEFHLIAEPVRTEILPGRVIDAWEVASRDRWLTI